ncbi:MAG TPA: bacteriocin [Prochlorococcaceae cyanobacterium Fu_MAG_50]|nr:bacteriocin [Prochlorococcaceae cyanobacterium Fu_MAG_50]
MTPTTFQAAGELQGAQTELSDEDLNNVVGGMPHFTQKTPENMALQMLGTGGRHPNQGGA